MDTPTQTITILIVLYKAITTIFADKSKLVTIPYIMSQHSFNGPAEPIRIGCKTIDQKKSLVHIIKFYTEGKKLNNPFYFEEYLEWFRYLCIDTPLKFFDISYYEKLNWKKYDTYISYLNNDYEKIFLTFQLNTYSKIEKSALDSILKKFNIRCLRTGYSETILYNLIEEAFNTKIYDDLLQLVTKHGCCSNITNSLKNIALSLMINKMTCLDFSDEEVNKIIGDSDCHKENNLLGFILMRRYILQNKIHKAIEIFIEVKTCNNEIFGHLFSISNDEQREVILQHCRIQNKFDSNNSNQDCVNYDVFSGIYLSIDETESMLDSVLDYKNNKNYCYNSELKKYIQN